ncbi:UNVERIFIED_CONTAM: hypothetical protein PYX00_002216 [Menopon gallinae]|uniref:Serine/threonine-protein phosphatase 4 regulatory subunit 4 n=1 Tax=Menopon gallinae TaxID=328185 RepID=A0AAW2IGD8_9NEOP
MSKYSGTPANRLIVSNQVGMRSRSSISQSGNTSGFSKDYEEFASLQLDKPLEGELKTSEEMKRHLFDDHFEGRPIERAMHLLAVGEEVQKLSVIRQLLQLIQADEQGCMQRVFPKLQQALNTASTEFHIETAKAFATILERRAISNHVFTQTFLPSILYHIDNRDQVVSNAWLDTLLEVTELLPVDIIRHEILHIAISKGQISQSVWHRVAACKLLGKLCTRFDPHTVKKDILPVVHSLCQDVNEAVRASICSELHHVAKGLPAEMVKPALIPILVELGRDETVQVRVEATETIVHMIPFLSQEVLKVTIIPLVKKICEQAVLAMDDTLVMVARQFGSLCLGLENCFTPSEKLWMVTYYNSMSHLGIPSHGAKKDVYFASHNMDRINARCVECRQLCAYNFPAMSKFCASNSELLEKLYPSFCDFATDPYYMVRKTIGCGIHEVARILGSNNRIVKNQVMTLLWDNMEEVLMGVVPHLGRTIDLLITSGVLGQEQDGATAELGRGLLQCDKTIRDKTHNWRLYTDFITQLESIVKCLPSDYIYTHFVSLMFDKMHKARALPCRLAAARTLLVFLRHNLKNNQRQEIRARIQAEFCMSSSCYKRMLFLRLCSIAREIFSRSYFKEHFFFLLLSRSDDKVANNRLLLVRQFPYLKSMIVMPNERKYLQTLETCIRNMAASEKDKDVTAELRLSVARLDKTDTLTDTPNMPTLEDIEDKKKFDEEIKLANMVPRPGAAIGILNAMDARRGAPQKPAERPTNYASGGGAAQKAGPASTSTQSKDSVTAGHTRVVSHSASSSHSATPSHASSTGSTHPSAPPSGKQSHMSSSSQAVVPKKPHPTFSESNSQIPSQGVQARKNKPADK